MALLGAAHALALRDCGALQPAEGGEAQARLRAHSRAPGSSTPKAAGEQLARQAPGSAAGTPDTSTGMSTPQEGRTNPKTPELQQCTVVRGWRRQMQCVELCAGKEGWHAAVRGSAAAT